MLRQFTLTLLNAEIFDAESPSEIERSVQIEDSSVVFKTRYVQLTSPSCGVVYDYKWKFNRWKSGEILGVVLTPKSLAFSPLKSLVATTAKRAATIYSTEIRTWQLTTQIADWNLANFATIF